ncbi:MAG TPA: tRNA glutamyl-Q(34) synthetase GluQRS, partial [Cellvibrionaceae bacterium]|nr:tRNA glutamyl-Q(34) synthetase GluQRS [Cellvibrionaceae bacterium]
PPREVPGAAESIVRSLERHGLVWDGPVLWQSQRSAHYEAVLEDLRRAGCIYLCSCTRKRLESLGHRYDGYCRHHPASLPAAWRLKVAEDTQIEFTDRHLGQQVEHLGAQGDFIIHRKDGLFAYALAVVVDDWQQGITHVVRGSDLLSATGNQIYLFNLLGAPAPRYAHIPVITNSSGLKLSKQNHAPALDAATPGRNLWRALWALGAKPPVELAEAAPSQVIDWGQQHWRLSQLPPGLNCPEAQLP